MSEPEKIGSGLEPWVARGYVAHDPSGPYVPTCSGRDVMVDGKRQRQECERHVEELVRPGRATCFTAQCKQCNELDYSDRWMKRMAAVSTPPGTSGAENALRDERERWKAAGHIFRGTSDRTHVDRRAGTE